MVSVIVLMKKKYFRNHLRPYVHVSQLCDTHLYTFNFKHL